LYIHAGRVFTGPLRSHRARAGDLHTPLMSGLENFVPTGIVLVRRDGRHGPAHATLELTHWRSSALCSAAGNAVGGYSPSRAGRLECSRAVKTAAEGQALMAVRSRNQSFRGGGGGVASYFVAAALVSSSGLNAHGSRRFPARRRHRGWAGVAWSWRTLEIHVPDSGPMEKLTGSYLRESRSAAFFIAWVHRARVAMTEPPPDDAL